MATEHLQTPATAIQSAEDRAFGIWREWQRLVLIRDSLEGRETAPPWVRREIAGDADLLAASARLSRRIAELLEQMLSLPNDCPSAIAVQFYVYCAVGRGGEDGDDVPAAVIREIAGRLCEGMPADFQTAFRPFADPGLTSAEALMVSETIRLGWVALEAVLLAGTEGGAR